MRVSYSEQLEELTNEVLEMGDKIRTRFEGSIQAMIDHDKEAADRIGKGDDEIDDQFLYVEKLCSDLLALQQPVASDLRQIVSTFKIITDLERIGDLIVNITDYTVETEGSHLIDEGKIKKLGDFANGMIKRSLEAFQSEDTEKARRVALADDEMDQMCEEATKSLLRHLIEWEEGGLDPQEAEIKGQQVTTELLAVRDLERVADHAVNIAARTVYMVTTERDLI